MLKCSQDNKVIPTVNIYPNTWINVFFTWVVILFHIQRNKISNTCNDLFNVYEQLSIDIRIFLATQLIISFDNKKCLVCITFTSIVITFVFNQLQIYGRFCWKTSFLLFQILAKQWAIIAKNHLVLKSFWVRPDSFNYYIFFYVSCQSNEIKVS